LLLTLNHGVIFSVLLRCRVRRYVFEVNKSCWVHYVDEMASSVPCFCFLGPFFIWLRDFVCLIAHVDLVLIDYGLLVAVFRWASPHLCRCSKMGPYNILRRTSQCSQSCFRCDCFKVRLVEEGLLVRTSPFNGVLFRRGRHFGFVWLWGLF